MSSRQEINIELLHSARDGDRKAQYTLFKYCFNLLMPVCFRYTKQEEMAREELNQAYVKIIFGLKNYDPEVNFDAWAKRITINSVIDNYRKNKKHLYNEDIDDVVVEHKLEHKNETEEDIGYKELLSLLEKLPFQSKKVFKLYVIEGYSHKEIAEMMNFSEGNSKWHLNNARTKMKEILKNHKHISLGLLVLLWTI